MKGNHLPCKVLPLVLAFIMAKIRPGISLVFKPNIYTFKIEVQFLDCI